MYINSGHIDSEPTDSHMIIANFNKIESRTSIPGKEATSQCNFCLKRVSMGEMTSHLRLCPVRREPCAHCGAKVSVLRMEIHLKEECSSANSDRDEIVTPYASLDNDDDFESDGTSESSKSGLDLIENRKVASSSIAYLRDDQENSKDNHDENEASV